MVSLCIPTLCAGRFDLHKISTAVGKALNPVGETLGNTIGSIIRRQGSDYNPTPTALPAAVPIIPVAPLAPTGKLVYVFYALGTLV